MEVLEDLYVADVKVNGLSVSIDSMPKLAGAMKQKVLQNAGVADSVFQRSFEYYMANPKQLELIYTALVDSLQLEEERARTKGASAQ